MGKQAGQESNVLKLLKACLQHLKSQQCYMKKMKATLQDKIETKYKQKWNWLRWFSFPSWQKWKNKHRGKKHENLKN